MLTLPTLYKYLTVSLSLLFGLRRILGKLKETEVAGTGSESCPMTGFGFTNV
jgi:hypothetical protein